VLHSGKIFWYSRKITVDDREEKHNEVEKIYTGVVLQIEGILRREKEKYCHLSPIEGDPLHPTQANLYVEPMTPCAPLRSETLLQTLVVSEGRKIEVKVVRVVEVVC
jgi:hypothetical protein